MENRILFEISMLHETKKWGYEVSIPGHQPGLKTRYPGVSLGFNMYTAPNINRVGNVGG